MSDDNLPENSNQPENEAETPKSSILPRRSRGNRRDEEEVLERDKLDELREIVSSKKSLVLAVSFIAIAAVLAGLINQDAGPADVDDVWNTVNEKLLEIRNDVSTGIFDIADHELAIDDANSNLVAKGYLQLELGTAGLKMAIGDNQPQFSQVKPQILFGDEATIASRVTQLVDAIEKLTDAIASFQKTKPSNNPLIDLGIYRANYSAAFIQEALMILDSPAEFVSHRDEAMKHLNQAKNALPPIGPSLPSEPLSSTDQAIKVLKDQIDGRLAAIETLSRQTFDADDLSSVAAKEDYFYSWLSTYIKNKHASEADAAGTNSVPDSPILPPTLTDPDRESVFPLNNEESGSTNATDESKKEESDASTKSSEEESGATEVQEGGNDQ